MVAKLNLALPASIKLLGLGGVGGIVARYLAVFLASLDDPARLVLIDGDAFEEGNSSRMLFSHCGNKAEVVRDELLEALGGSSVAIEAISQFVSPENVDRLIREGDVVILAVDNHATRRLVSEHCARLRDLTLISGGNDGVGRNSSGQDLRGTYGNVQIQKQQAGVERSPALTRFHPEIEDPADKLPGDLSCAELVESVPQILFTNLTTATCILNTVLLHFTGALHYSELHFDTFEALMRPSAQGLRMAPDPLSDQ